MARTDSKTLQVKEQTKGPDAGLEEALHRLDTALALLETAVARKLEAERSRGDRETEFALLEEDRVRLAAELDAAGARLARMTSTTGEVNRRLDRAIETVEDVLSGSAGR
ncbi:DUF4164 family protein [Methylobacterium sp. DB1607]|jgi:hypothetical protein|nr:DUF4164 family protein [Methylobacterium sp. DB1607]